MKNKFRLMLIGLSGLIFALACSTFSRPAPTATPLPTPDSTARHLQVFTVVWEAVRDQYVRPDYDGVDWEAIGQKYRAKIEAGLDEEAFNQTLREMLAELPEGQASFQTREERLEAETTNTSQYQGIGAFVAFRAAPEPHIVILSVIRDSPAEEAGLQAHDSIYAIDGEPVREDEEATLTERIRGPAGTSVTLTLQSPTGDRRDLTIKRGEITASDTPRGGYIESLGVAYYRVPVIANADTVEIIAQDLAEINAAEIKGIILDLRIAHSSNQGWPLGQMLTLFGDGELGEFYDRDKTEKLQIEGQSVGGSQTTPLVLLIGPDTQGSPEIFAGALRGVERATLVGLPTPGDIEQFSEISLPDGSRLFLATGSFRTSDGIDLAETGLKPDLRVTADWDMVSNDDDPAIEAALSVLLSSN